MRARIAMRRSPRLPQASEPSDSNPVLVGEDGDIIAGHGRLAAARQLGLTEVPVIVLSGLTDLQRRQLMLADNRISLNAGWDFEMLHLELKDLAVLGADLAVLGFTNQELAQALKPAGATGLTGEDEVPELSERAVTTVGDIWCAGSHRAFPRKISKFNLKSPPPVCSRPIRGRKCKAHQCDPYAHKFGN
jgi:hypothetical protein